MQVWLSAAVSFWATPAQTVNLFTNYSLSCLSDEVMWVRIRRMGFSVETDTRTTHLNPLGGDILSKPHTNGAQRQL